MQVETPENLPMESLLTPAVDLSAAPAVATPAGSQHTDPPLTRRDEWYARAARVMPYGVSSNFRFWGADKTLVLARGKGAHVWDVDGRRYIDYRLGFGPVLLGHAFDPVNAAVYAAMQDGNVFAATHVHEIEAAERFTRMTGTEMVRWTNSGAESTMHALRIARAHTNREVFIKFEGCYHGAHDNVMWSTPSSPISAMGSRRSPNPVPSSSGLPRVLAEKVLTLPYNDIEVFERTMRDRGHEIAAVFVEPMMGNVAAVMPAPGWLQSIRAQCDAHGTVMIMDEVKTGFRIAPGGAQQHFGVRADLVTYAKAMANGFPIGAIAGKREFMMTIEPGAVGQGGTYCGNIVAVAACNATLAYIEENRVHEQINARGTRLMQGIDDCLTRHHVPHVISGLPSMFGVIYGMESADGLDYRAVCKHADDECASEIIAALHTRGIMPDPDFGEPWFMSFSHSNTDVDLTLEALEEVLREVREL
jgi:glutamate-1-semialdehyde 2,1-aminomutase